MPTTTADLSDRQIQDAWIHWEDPEIIAKFVIDWVEMTHRDKVALFVGLVLPEACGAAGRRVTLERALGLGLVSRYPSSPG
jgi:hypothetical protein